MRPARRVVARWTGAWHAAVLASVSIATPALAEQPPAHSAPARAEPAAAAQQARLRYEQGKAAYSEGRYADAIQAFAAADASAPRAVLSFDIARAYERLGDPARAIDAYRAYLRRAPDAANADLVRARIAELEAATPPPAPSAQPSESLVAAAPVSPPNVAHADSTKTYERPTFAPWSWVTLATGGALLASAGVVELVRRGADSDAQSAPTQLAYADDYQRMRSYQSAARVLAGVGGALAVTGGVLVAIDLGRGRRAETRVGCTPNACFGGIEGSF